MGSIKKFLQMDIVKETVWTVVIFLASLFWSLMLMLCIDFMFFAYNSITMMQFFMVAFIIACVITAHHIYVTAQKYKRRDASVL